MNELAIMKSIVIHMPILADFMNLQLINVFKESVSEDKTTWRYYMNLNGDYHSSNKKITVHSIDTGEDISFDKITMIDHPKTMFSLRQYGNALSYLKKDNPGEDLLIHGILNPIPYDKSINARPYEVMYIDKSLYNNREFNLLNDIEASNVSFIDRWYVEDYKIEDRYIPTIIFQLLYNTFTTIQTSRLNKLNTEEVSEYNLVEFLRNHIYANTILELVPETVKLYLYKNIKKLMVLTGREETIKEITEEILHPSGFNLQRIVYDKPKYVTNVDANDVFVVPWVREHRMKLVELLPNKDGIILESNGFNEMVYLDMSADYTKLSIKDKTFIKEVTPKKTNGVEANTLTKSFLLSRTSNVSKLSEFDNNVLFNNWLFDALTNVDRTVAKVELVGYDSVEMSANEAVVSLLFLMLNQLGITDPIQTLHFNNVFTKNNLDAVKLSTNYRDIDVKKEFTKLLPTKSLVYNNLQYKDWMDEVKVFLREFHTLENTVSEEINRFNLDRLFKYSFGEKNLNIYLDFEPSIGIFSNKPLNIKENLTTILKAFNEDLSNFISLDSGLELMSGFIKKLISYNVQILTKTTTTKLETTFSTSNLISGYNEFFFNTIEMHPLEIVDFNLRVEPIIDYTGVFVDPVTNDKLYGSVTPLYLRGLDDYVSSTTSDKFAEKSYDFNGTTSIEYTANKVLGDIVQIAPTAELIEKSIGLVSRVSIFDQDNVSDVGVTEAILVLKRNGSKNRLNVNTYVHTQVNEVTGQVMDIGLEVTFTDNDIAILPSETILIGKTLKDIGVKLDTFDMVKHIDMTIDDLSDIQNPKLSIAVNSEFVDTKVNVFESSINDIGSGIPISTHNIEFIESNDIVHIVRETQDKFVEYSKIQ